MGLEKCHLAGHRCRLAEVAGDQPGHDFAQAGDPIFGFGDAIGALLFVPSCVNKDALPLSPPCAPPHTPASRWGPPAHIGSTIS